MLFFACAVVEIPACRQPSAIGIVVRDRKAVDGSPQDDKRKT
jgi:hypothetical protein